MANILRLSPAICVYPDDTYKSLKIEVVLLGVENLGVEKENIS